VDNWKAAAESQSSALPAPSMAKLRCASVAFVQFRGHAPAFFQAGPSCPGSRLEAPAL
jgi:hypothetical protein